MRFWFFRFFLHRSATAGEQPVVEPSAFHLRHHSRVSSHLHPPVPHLHPELLRRHHPSHPLHPLHPSAHHPRHSLHAALHALLLHHHLLLNLLRVHSRPLLEIIHVLPSLHPTLHSRHAHPQLHAKVLLLRYLTAHRHALLRHHAHSSHHPPTHSGGRSVEHTQYVVFRYLRLRSWSRGRVGEGAPAFVDGGRRRRRRRRLFRAKRREVPIR